MRIGIDAACWLNGRGYGRFTRELLRALVAVAADDEFVLFIDETAEIDLAARNVRFVRVRQAARPVEAAAADGSRSVLDMWRLMYAVWREPLDVFFSPSVYTYFPLPPGRTAVVTVHDTIAERFPELTLPSRRARLFWKLKVWLALRQAHTVLTVSDFAAREIAEVLGVAPGRIRVALEAPSPVYRPADEDEVTAAGSAVELPYAAQWFVYVGGFSPHKRVDAIVRAHAEIVAEARSKGAPPPYLLLIGRRSGDVFHGALAQIEAAITACGTGRFIRWTGFVADEELRKLLTGARALILASECEGFGLPALEAAACGAPVIATVASPLPELLAGGGLFVPPGDAEALVGAMRVLLDDDVRRRMGARARLCASALSWRATAESTLAALRDAANSTAVRSVREAVA